MSSANVDLPRPRPRPQKAYAEASRESNALRASVLDAALQLGLGSNSLVADWMFNGPLKEEDEDQLPSPGLTHSESPTSSPLSGRYPLTPSSPSSQNHSGNYTHNLNNVHLQYANTVPFALSSESSSLIPHVPASVADTFTPTPIPPRPVTPSKLKKKRTLIRDGYESEGDGKRKKDKDKEKKKEQQDKDQEKGARNRPVLPRRAMTPLPSSSAGCCGDAPGQETASLDITEEPRKRKKSLVKAMPPAKAPMSLPSSPLDPVAFDPDFLGKRSKTKKWISGKKNGLDEDKDVKKTKSLFSRLGNMTSKVDMKAEKERERGRERERERERDNEKVQKEEKVVLPIAEKFATTLSLNSGGSVVGTASPSLTRTALPPSGGGEGSLLSDSGSKGLGIDLGLGLSGDMFSTSSLKTPPSTQIFPVRQPSPLAIRQHTANSTPPVSFPPSSTNAPNGRPGSPNSVGTGARTSTSTNANSQSSGNNNSGASRTSEATSVSTSQSQPHSTAGVPVSIPLRSLGSRESSNDGSSSAASAHVPIHPQTPSKRRVLPFLGGGGGGTSGLGNGHSPGGDLSEKGKEKVRKREEREREKEREKERKREKERLKEEREREKAGKKSLISLPITRAASPNPSDTIDMGALQPPFTSSHAAPVPSTPSRTRQANLPMDGVHGSRPPLFYSPASRHLQQPSSVSKQTSMPSLRADTNPPVAAASLGGRTSPLPKRAPSPLSLLSGRISPLKGARPGKLMDLVTGRNSPLPTPKITYHDMPPPSPPPLSPLPSVPGGASLPPVNVGIAVTTGSPLPSPLLVGPPRTHPSSSLDADADAGADASTRADTPLGPADFDPSTATAAAVAGNALRAKVQRRLSQRDQKNGFGLGASGITGVSAALAAPPSDYSPNTNLTVPTMGPSVQRGRESPFPISPINANGNAQHHRRHSSQTQIAPVRGTSPKSGWDDDYDDGEDGVLEVDEGVRSVLARFRESRIEYGKRRMEEGRKEVPEGVIATRRSFEAIRGSAAPSSSVGVGIGNNTISVSSGEMGSGKYDSFTIEEFYTRDSGVGSADGKATEGRYDDDLDDGEGSYYPEDEIPDASHPDRRSRRRRSTLYLEDEDSSIGHGDGVKTGRNSRWSGSIYSRASIMDNEKSGETRERFMQRVEAMLDERDRVPPVPKVPQEYLNEPKGGAATSAGVDGVKEQYVVKRTVGIGARKVPASSVVPRNGSRV